MAGPRRALDGNRAGIANRESRESRRDPGKILAGKQNSRRPKSCRDHASISPRILAGKQKTRRPKSRRDPAANGRIYTRRRLSRPDDLNTFS